MRRAGDRQSGSRASPHLAAELGDKVHDPQTGEEFQAVKPHHPPGPIEDPEVGVEVKHGVGGRGADLGAQAKVYLRQRG